MKKNPKSRSIGKNILSYTILLQPEPEGGYTVTVPNLPGCVTYGKDLREAKRMARDAIELYIEDLKADDIADSVTREQPLVTTLEVVHS